MLRTRHMREEKNEQCPCFHRAYIPVARNSINMSINEMISDGEINVKEKSRVICNKLVWVRLLKIGWLGKFSLSK